MPLTTTTPGADGPRRRRVLAGGAAALLTAAGTAVLAGCSSADAGAAEHSSAAKRLRERAGRDAAALLERYDATIAAHAPLAARLRPLRAEVARHAEAFGSAKASPSPSASPSAPPVSVPREEKAALAALADAERRTADARTSALGQAPPELARLLASVAAAGAAHAYLLAGGAA